MQYTIVDEDSTVGLFSLKAFQILHVDRVRLIACRVFISSYIAPKFLLSIVKPICIYAKRECCYSSIDSLFTSGFFYQFLESILLQQKY